MNIFTGDNKIIQKEIEELLKVIEETKTRALPIYQTTETLIYFYELLTGKKTDYFRRLTTEDYSIIEKKEQILENRKIENVLSTREIHEELFAYLSTYLEEVDSFSKGDGFFEHTILDEKEMYEIIQDFLKSRNQNAAFAFDFLIKEKRIFKMPNKEELDRAYNLLNQYKNNFYIFVKDGDNIVTTMTDIVHEIGHVMDQIQLLHSGKRRECNYYIMKSSLIETIPMMYEKAFLDFLLEENIYRKYVEQEIEGYYASFQFYSEQIELPFYLPDEWLRRDRYKGLAKQDFISYLEESYPIIVEQEVITSPSDMDLSNQLSYCYGSAISTYFSYLRSHDYSRYQENFHNFLKLRAGYFPSDFFSKIGTTPQELSNIVGEEYEKVSSKRMIK